MPLVNALLTEEQVGQPEPTYPLDLAFCPQCALAQITETVPPETLFRDYVYFSSSSDTVLTHARDLALRMVAERHLSRGSLVVEVACNDGYLLQYYADAGIPVLGVEPARNVAKVAQERRGIPVVEEFFSASLARQMTRDMGRRADVLHASNVLAHVADPNGFVEGIAALLKDDGVAVIEVHYVKDLVDKCEFDTIYHEHISYFSLASLLRLFRRHGLLVVNAERIPAQGGSLRVFAAKSRATQHSCMAVSELLMEELIRCGLDDVEFFSGFAARVEALRQRLLLTLRNIRLGGKRIAAYGAAAKGAVLLNYCGIGRGLLDFVVDRSPAKQWRYVPGVHVPIFPPERLLAEMPDYTLLLAWNLTEEILTREAEYRRRGGRFIIPLPELGEM